MIRDINSVWNNCLHTIRKNVNDQSFKTWFEPITPVQLSQDSLTIQVPNKIFYEWLEEHYVSLLKMTIRKELGDAGKLEYQIRTAELQNGRGVNGDNRGKVSLAEDREEVNLGTPDIKNPFVIPGIQKPRLDSQLNPIYRFDNFIEGDCNRLPRSAGIAIAKKPGATAFNPLVIFGDVGLGKTHLVQAIGNKVQENFPNKSVLYVSAEKFTNQIVQSIKNHTTNDLVNFYQMVDVLIVDDIQFLANKTKTQEIFFHIFNQLHQNGKQLVLTSDRAPKDLDGMEERMISRFKWGLSADLTIPEFETRMAILESKMMREGIELPDDVVEFICFNIKNNIRELEGVLVSLAAQSSLANRNIDINLTKEVIKKFIKEINKEITVEFIQKLVADHFQVPVEKLAGKTRKRSIVVARQLSMYLAKNLTNKSLKSIGEMFGGRDHSTVIYSCNTVQDLLDTDPAFKDDVHVLERKIKLSLNEK